MGEIHPDKKATPLQWASFKGHAEIVSLLLKEGLDYRECDSFGSNSIHLAAASGNVEVIENLLMWGVKIESVNSRGHKPKDLSSNDELRYIL